MAWGPILIAYALGILSNRLDWSSVVEAVRYTWAKARAVTGGVSGGASTLIPVGVLLVGLVMTFGTGVTFSGCPGPGPQPIPIPTPDPPKPPDPPAPIPLEGLRVLFVVESKDDLPAGQREILDTPAHVPGSVYAYLETHCVKVNGLPEIRKYDKDNADLSRDAPHWQEAMKLPRTGTPWMVASNGKQGYNGPLPATAAECLKILKAMGGE